MLSLHGKFTDRGHPHPAEDGLQRPPFPCCIAAWWLRRPEPREEQERILQRIPKSLKLASKKGLRGHMIHRTRFGLPTSLRANHRNGFSKL